MKHNESKLQQACVKWFRLQYPHFKLNLFAIPNGGNRSVITASILKAEGVVAGVADMMLAVPRNGFHGLWLETKHGKNDLSEKQEDFKQAVQKQGYKHVTFRTFDEFEREITAYLGESVEMPVFYMAR